MRQGIRCENRLYKHYAAGFFGIFEKIFADYDSMTGSQAAGRCIAVKQNT